MAKNKAAKGVLGNDPFLRGAAPRAPSSSPPNAVEKPEADAAPVKEERAALRKTAGPGVKAVSASKKSETKAAGRAAPKPGSTTVKGEAKSAMGRANASSRSASASAKAEGTFPGDATTAASPVKLSTTDRTDARGKPVSKRAAAAQDSAPEVTSPGRPKKSETPPVRVVRAEEPEITIPGRLRPEPVQEPRPPRAPDEVTSPGRRTGVAASAEPSAPKLHVIANDDVAPGGEPPFTAREPGEAFHSSAVPVSNSGSLSDRAAGALSLAREILIHALQNQRVDDIRRAGQGLLEVIFSAIGTAGSTDLDAFGRDAELVEKLRPLTDFLYERYWRVTVEGAVHVPSGPAILVANHSGAVPYDGPVLSAALARERPDLELPRWLVEDQIFYAPFFGTLLNRLGAVRANPDNATRLLADGRPLFVFPEGFQGLSKPYSERYQLKRFGRGGFVKIALRQGCPIVPVAVVGSEETTPLLAKLPGKILGLPYIPLTPLGPLPLPARWNIRFGEPIDLERLGPDAAEDITAVQRLTDRTREAIRDMLRTQLHERGSTARV